MKENETIKSIAISFFIVVFLWMLFLGVKYTINAPTEGEIVLKVYNPPIVSGGNETRDYQPEKFQIVIQKKDDEGVMRQNVVTVDDQTFHTVELGQWFDMKCFCVESR